MAELTDEQYNEVKKLCMLSKEYLCFEFDGFLIKGNVAYVIKDYVKESTSKSPLQWMKDSGRVLIEL